MTGAGNNQAGNFELELSAALEYRLRLLGHQGLVRVRNWDLDLFYGHVLSGTAGLHPAYTDTPSGGLGFQPRLSPGAVVEEAGRGEPISIDLVACVNGYLVDMIRMYAWGPADRAWKAWELVQGLHRTFQQEARPGVMARPTLHRLWDWSGPGGCRTAHGYGPRPGELSGPRGGAEVDEFPFISARFPFPLAENVVLAFEPKSSCRRSAWWPGGYRGHHRRRGGVAHPQPQGAQGYLKTADIRLIILKNLFN